MIWNWVYINGTYKTESMKKKAEIKQSTQTNEQKVLVIYLWWVNRAKRKFKPPD